MTEYFDWKYYTNKYKELERANINTKEKAYLHWQKYGMRQNRICNIIFEDVDLDLYIKINRLKISNREQLYIHFHKNYLKNKTVEPTVETIIEPTVETIVEPTVETIIEPTVETVVEPTVETIIEPTVETVVEPTVETVVESTVEPTVETVVESTVDENINNDILIEEQINQIDILKTDEPNENMTDIINEIEEVILTDINPVIEKETNQDILEVAKISKRQSKKQKKLEVLE